MSTKELTEEANKLLESTWDESEKILVKKMLDTMLSYKSMIPKFLKADIKALLVMANRIKLDYDELVIKYKALSTCTLDSIELENEQLIESLQNIELKINNDLKQ